MPTLNDYEFGDIAISVRKNAHSVRISVRPSGSLVATVPPLTPIFFIKGLVNKSRVKLRQLLANQGRTSTYKDGQKIGYSHQIAVINTGLKNTPEIKTLKNKLLVYLPPTFDISNKEVQQKIRNEVVVILRKEAKKYLPDRLKNIAATNGLHYLKVQFRHASSRWGSCSSTGTISLNIGLMKLPAELIDYVLVHELCHTVHMNHSKEFWNLVHKIDINFKNHKKRLKLYSPNV